MSLNACRLTSSATFPKPSGTGGISMSAMTPRSPSDITAQVDGDESRTATSKTMSNCEVRSANPRNCASAARMGLSVKSNCSLSSFTAANASSAAESSKSMVAPFGELVEVGLTSIAKAERPPHGSLWCTKARLPSLGEPGHSFALGLTAGGPFYVAHSSPASRARARTSAAALRASRFSSLIAASAALARTARRSAAARACGSVGRVISISSAFSGGRLPVGPAKADSPVKGQTVSGARLSAFCSTAAMGVVMQTMDRSFVPSQWKDRDRSGKDWKEQGDLALIGRVPDASPVLADPSFISVSSNVGALRYAVQRSGLDDFEVADDVGISHSYICKVLKGTAGLHGMRLVNFMRVTKSLAPLQWLAAQMGCDVVQRDSRAAEVAALQARINDLQRGVA